MLVLHELPGLSSPTLDFSQELARRGWTVYAPALFGKYGDHDPFAAKAAVKQDQRWRMTDPHDAGPILAEISAIVSWISREHRGQRVIVTGNCLTGDRGRDGFGEDDAASQNVRGSRPRGAREDRLHAAAARAGCTLLPELGAPNDRNNLTGLGLELAKRPLDPTLVRRLLQVRAEGGRCRSCWSSPRDFLFAV